MKRNSYFKCTLLKIMTAIRTSVVILSFGLVALILYPDTVFAHAELIKSEPANRATLSTSTEQVKLWFNEEIEVDYASLSLVDKNGNILIKGKPMAHPDDLKSIYVELPELEKGRYTVKYRVLSVDGHVLESDYKFTIKKKGTE
jgi:methionine-rich copper-binding protein CopC